MTISYTDSENGWKRVFLTTDDLLEYLEAQGRLQVHETEVEEA